MMWGYSKGMTKTYKAKGHEMTATDSERNGRHALRVTCSCATHKGSGAAIVVTPTSAEAYDRKLIHGVVTMAHSPMGKAAAAQTGIWAA